MNHLEQILGIQDIIVAPLLHCEGRTHPPCLQGSPINPPISQRKNTISHLMASSSFLPEPLMKAADKVAALLHSQHETSLWLR